MRSISLQERLEQPASGAAAAKGKVEGPRKNKWWRLRAKDNKRSVLSRCGVKHDPERKRESKGTGKDHPALHDGILWKK